MSRPLRATAPRGGSSDRCWCASSALADVSQNWNFSGNGNSLELEELGGKRRRALFLHLSELPRSLKPGARFSTGQVMAESGNSGHSFAPHLHYQLMTQDDRVVDPFDSHRTYRRTLSAEQRPALETEIRRLDSLLNPAVAGN